MKFKNDAYWQALAAHCPGLTMVYAWGTAITDVGWQALAAHCPDLIV